MSWQFESNEEEKLLEYAEKYQTELEKHWDKREYKVTVVDINGKSVFITRYFKALKPPQELLDQHTDAIATSVSMDKKQSGIMVSSTIYGDEQLIL